MKLKTKTVPDLSSDSPVHQQAIVDGDEHFRRWQRNVIDEFKDLSEEEIKQRLEVSAFPYAICCENFINDFNIATTFRNANVFNAREVFYIGNKKIDRRGMQGVHNYMNITWLPTIEDFNFIAKSYTVVGADNIPGAISIDDYVWKPNSLMVFGSESVGLTPQMQSFCKDIVFIPQHGSIRSLNVATVSGIFMFDFVRKLRRFS